MFNRYPIATITATAAALALGIILGTIGLLADSNTAAHAGMLVSIAALPTLTVAMTNRRAAATEEQLTDAHTEGYRLALHHVAEGLLTDNTSPTPGTPRIEWAENVVPFPRRADTTRKAQ
ncbi:hypothetical protein ACWGRF_01885 [Streptomyces zhihengii]